MEEETGFAAVPLRPRSVLLEASGPGQGRVPSTWWTWMFKDQGGTASITVYHGTDSRGNDTNWTFDGTCTGAPTAIKLIVLQRDVLWSRRGPSRVEDRV